MGVLAKGLRIVRFNDLAQCFKNRSHARESKNLPGRLKKHSRVWPREAKGFEFVEFKVIFKIIPLRAPADDHCIGPCLPEFINNGSSTTFTAHDDPGDESADGSNEAVVSVAIGE